MAAHQLELVEARRIAIRAQLLDAPRPTELLEVIERLEFLQIDPTAAVAPSADLMAWSRLGRRIGQPTCSRPWSRIGRCSSSTRLNRPIGDLRLVLAEWRAGRLEKARGWLAAKERFQRDILERLGESGPLLSRDIPDTSAVPGHRPGGRRRT